MKKSFVFVAALLASAAVFATPGGESGNTQCNGQGNPNSPCTPSNGGAGGAGGQGGAGGHGGTAIAGAAAAAQAQANAAAIAAQQQGQAQGQTQSSRNTNTAAGGRATATGGAGGQATATGGTSGGNTITVAVEGAKGDTYIAPAQERAPVATAYAAPLTASNGTCMGSTSGGGQTGAIGFTFGSTWTDASCDIRYDAEALRAAGLPLAAQARLCQKADIAKAMEAAGTPCPGTGAKRAAAVLNGAPVTAEAAPVPYQDPIIRARLGLPPL